MTEILTGGEIVTLDPERPAAEAVAVRDGVIVGVGDKEALRGENPDAAESDIAGGCLIPSLIDHHLHQRRNHGGNRVERKFDRFRPRAGDSPESAGQFLQF